MVKISVDVAEKEFDRFIDAMCIDSDLTNMGEDDIESFNEHKRKIVNAISKGDLIINENCEPVYTPKRSDNKDPITFYEPTGADLAEQDKRAKGQDHTRLFTTMGSMTKTSSSRFAKMKMYDLKICQAITVLFLA